MKGKRMSDEKDEKSKGDEKGQQKPDEETKKDLEEILGQLKESDKKKEKEAEEAPDDKGDFSFQPHQPEGETESEPEGLDGILDKISETEAEEPVEDQNAIQRIINVFFNPLKLFRYLRQKPEFMLPLVLAVLIGVGTAYLVYDIAIDDQIARFEQNDRISTEQKDLIIDRMEESRTGTTRILYSVVIPFFAVIILFFLISAVFLFIGNVLLGGKAKYKQVLSVYGYSYLIMGILGTIVKLPLILKQHTVKIDTSLAVLFSPASMSTALYNFIGSFDIFTVWFLIVFGIGFAVIYRFSKLKALASVFIAWLAYVVIFKVLLGSLFSGFGA